MFLRQLFVILLLIAISGIGEVEAQRHKDKGKRVNVELSDNASTDSLPFEERITELAINRIVAIPSEKLFLHLDKESCQPGDTLWYRAYLTSATTNTPVDYSRYIYVEIVDRFDRVYEREKISRSEIDSTFSGYISVSDNLRQGEYFVRAYTYYMQNEEEDYIFRKRIRVIDPFDSRITCKLEVESNRNGSRTLKVTFLNSEGERYENLPFNYTIPGETPPDTYLSDNTGYNGQSRITINDPESDHILISTIFGASWDYEEYLPIPGCMRSFAVQFFPEGGELVGGEEQRIAFKSVGRDGLGIKVHGRVVDEEGVKICDIESNELGMGSLYITPSPMKEYTAILETDEGNEKSFTLPPCNGEALALQLTSRGEYCSYRVVKSQSMTDTTESPLAGKYLFIHCRGIPLGIFRAEAMESIWMDLSDSPEGIISFLLLDSTGTTYSERLFFHRKSSPPDLSIEKASGRVLPREDATINLRLDGEGVEGSFSVSVVNNGQTAIDTLAGGILAELLLTSDLKGYIESPGYYFLDESEERVRALDELMLTQGWSRFDISDVVKNTPIPEKRFYMERGQFLSGHVKNFLGKNSANSDIILIGSNGIARKLKTDSEGRFIEDDLWYDEGTRFVVQAIGERGKSSLELQLDEPEFEPPKSVESEAVFANDKSFYARYSKDYIFASNGERINSLISNVKVGGRLNAREEIVSEYLGADTRKYFMLGVNNVSNFGWAPGAMTPISFNSDGPYSGMVNNSTYYRDVYLYLAKGWRPMASSINYVNDVWSGDIEDILDISPELVEEWREAEKNSKISNGEGATTIVHKEQAVGPKILGVSVSISPYSAAQSYTSSPVANLSQTPNVEFLSGIRITPIYDLSVTTLDYMWNMQTIVPFAPQQKNREFYKPSYNVPTELLKEPVDEKITRYWNPVVQLSSGETFSVTFPTADGAGNHSYTLTVEGLTSDGVPIHKTYRYEL